MNKRKNILIVICSLILTAMLTVNASASMQADAGNDGLLITDHINYGSTAELLENEVIPQSYSSRDLGYTPTVKSQGTTNLCWIFSTLSSFETLLIKDGNFSSTFSVSHLDNWATVNNDEGWARNYITDGCTLFAAEGYLTSWQGPKYESEFPFRMDQVSYDKLKLNENGDYGVTGIMLLNNSDVDAIKKAIMDYGAVTAGYSSSSAYYSTNRLSYFCPISSTSGAHAISVVGWDDNYSRTNFNPRNTLPTNDGAWLIKNSWGENDNSLGGYFWISYEDANLFSRKMEAFAITEYQLLDENDKIYQHDIYGATGKITFSTLLDSVTYMNVYDFSNEDILDKVVFQCDTQGVNYNIYLIPTDDSGTPVSSDFGWINLSSGTVDYTGYISANITDYDIPEGKYAVGVDLQTTSGNTSLIKSSSIGICERLISGGADYFKYQSDLKQSFFTNNNNEITDLHSYIDDSYGATFSIKAITYSNGANNYELGDSDLNGIINIRDATLIQKYVANIIELSEEQKKYADINGDNTINGIDVTSLQKIIAGLTQ